MIYCWAPFLITYSYLDAYKNWHIMPHLQTRDNIQMCFLVNPFHKSQHFSLWKSPTTYPSFRPSLVVLDGNEIFNWKMAQRYLWFWSKLNTISFLCLTTSRSLSLSDFIQFLRDKGAFTNYVYKIWLFLTTYPPPFTFSMVWKFTKSRFFWPPTPLLL